MKKKIASSKSIKKYASAGEVTPGNGRDSIPSGNQMIVRPGYQWDPKVKGTRVINSGNKKTVPNNSSKENPRSPGWPQPLKKQKLGGSVGTKSKMGGSCGTLKSLSKRK